MENFTNFESVAHITEKEYFAKGGDFSIDTYRRKYPLDEIEAQFPAKLFLRIAKTAASFEATPELQDYWMKRWFHEFWIGLWRPAGSILSGLGNPSKISSSNCTTIELKGDTLEDIFETAYKTAKAAAYRQGLGIDFSQLRPAGTKIRNSAKVSTGSISWMDFINTIGKHVGQCLHPDTKILTTGAGYRTIKDIVDTKSVVQIYTPTGTSKVVNWFENDKKDIYELTTEYGDRLLLSEDHQLKGINRVKPLKNFRAGDFITCRRVLDYPQKDYVKIKPFKFIKDDYDQSNRISIPKKCPDVLNEKLAYLAGLIYGDGYTTDKNSIELALRTEWISITQKVNDYLFDLFGERIENYGLSIHKNDGAVETLCIGRWYHDFFKSFGIEKTKTGTLVFPECIKNSPKSVLFAFIAGVFDANGHNSSKKKNIELCMIDYKFLYDLKLEAAKYGVIFKIKTGNYLIPLNKFKRSRHRLSFVDKLSKIIFSEGTLSERLILHKEEMKYDRLKTPYKAADIKLSVYKLENKDVNTSEYLSDEKYTKYTGKIAIEYIQKISKIKKLKEQSITYDITVEDDSHLFSAENVLVKNSGRIPAMLFSLNIKHPDIIEFLTVKSNLHKIQNANISVQITDDFMKAYETDSTWDLVFDVKDGEKIVESVKKTVKAKDLMKLLAKEACAFAEPGVQFIDTCIRESMTDAVGFKIKSTNACCIAENTLVTTKQGHFRCKDLINKSIDIWDGKTWVCIDNFNITNTYQPMLKIIFEDGSFERTTEYHTILLENGDKIKTINLKPGDVVKNSNCELLKGNIPVKGAYAKGFLVGNGTLSSNIPPNPSLHLYNTKYRCFKRLKRSLEELDKEVLYHTGTTVTDISLSEEYDGIKKAVRGLSQFSNQLKPWCSEYKLGIPDELYNWNTEDKLEFLAGLFDADGTSQNTQKSHMYQITSISENLLLDIQKLLKTIGVYSKVRLAIEAQYREIKTKKYYTKDLYRLTITQIDSINFAKMVKFERLEDLSKKMPLRKTVKSDLSRFIVKEVIKDGIDTNVYCCTVNSTNSFALSCGIQIGNSEKFMTPDSTCVLASVNLGILPKENYEEELTNIAQSMVRFLDNCISYELSEHKTPFPSQHEIVSQLREIGLGITNLNGWLLKHNLGYDTDEGISATEQLIKTFSLAAWKQTIALGVEKGNAPAFQTMLNRTGSNEFIYTSDFAKRLKTEGIDVTSCRNMNVMSIAPTGSLSLTFPMEIDSTGIEPITAFYYWKRSRTSGEWQWFFVIPSFVRNRLAAEGYTEIPTTVSDQTGEIGEKWVKIINKYFDPAVFKPSHYIDPLKKIELMSRVAKWIDSSISVTYNLKESVTADIVESIYYEAWKKGVKSIAVYRDKSRQGVIEVESPRLVEKRFLKAQSGIIEAARPSSIILHSAAKRPKELEGKVHKVSIKGNKFIVLIGLLEGLPYEVFIAQEEELKELVGVDKGTLIKKGAGKYNFEYGNDKLIKDISSHIKNHDYEDRTRLISLSLRSGAPIDYVVEQLEKTVGTVVDASHAIARILKKYIGAYYRLKKCSNCGSSNIEIVEGCALCMDCGSSKCD